MRGIRFKLRSMLLLAAFVLAVGSAHAQDGGAVAKFENLSNEFLAEPSPDESRKLDEYGLLRSNDEKARLDDTFISLNSKPDAKMYVVVSCKTASICNSRKYRVSSYARVRGQDPRRFTFVMHSGNADPITQLWLVPPGAEPPR